MKPFDLEKAKAGDPVCLNDGSLIRILCFDRKHPIYKLVILSQNNSIGIENTEYCAEDGTCPFGNRREPHLFMSPKKRTLWTNYYNGSACAKTGMLGGVFESKEEAKKFAYDYKDYKETFSFEVEE